MNETTAKMNNILLSEPGIPFFETKTFAGDLYIKIEGEVVISEVHGYWNNNPIITHNNEKYVVLESAKKLVSTNNLGIIEEKIENSKSVDKKEEEVNEKLANSLKNILQNSAIKKPETSVPSPSASSPKPQTTQFPKAQVQSKAPAVSSPVNSPVKKDESAESKKNETPKTDTSVYMSTSNKDVSNTPKETNPSGDKDFFSMLEKQKDDPRVKNFFNYHTELAKKELFAINEKFAQQQMARAMESGGGTNAMQFANGGLMSGDLVIDGSLTVNGYSYLAGGGGGGGGGGIDPATMLSINTRISSLSTCCLSSASAIRTLTTNVSSLSTSVWTLNTTTTNLSTAINNTNTNLRSLCSYVSVYVLSADMYSALASLSTSVYNTINNLSSNSFSTISALSTNVVAGISALSSNIGMGVSSLSATLNSLSAQVLALSSNKMVSINYVMDGGGASVTNGTKGFIQVPSNFIPKEWTIVTDVSAGTFTVDVKKATYSSLPTATSITNGNYITVQNAYKNRQTNITNWNNISGGDFVQFDVTVASNAKLVNICIKGDQI